MASVKTDIDVYNKVPDFCEILIDIRYNAQCNISKVFEILNGLDYVSYEIYAKTNPFYSDINNIVISKYIEKCKEVLKREVEIIECLSASDAGFFPERGIPAIIMNPCGSDMHGKQECVEMHSLNQLLSIYEKYVDEI